MTRLSHFSFQMFWLLFTTNYGTLQLDYILAIVGAGHHSFLWTKTTTNCGVIHNLVSLCDDAIYSWFFFIMQLDYILAIVVSGHNSFLWTKATTFLKSQRVYLLGPSGTEHCSQNFEQTHRSVNNASPWLLSARVATIQTVIYLFH